MGLSGSLRKATAVPLLPTAPTCTHMNSGFAPMPAELCSSQCGKLGNCASSFEMLHSSFSLQLAAALDAAQLLR